MPIGRLIRKIQCQLIASVRTPPSEQADRAAGGGDEAVDADRFRLLARLAGTSSRSSPGSPPRPARRRCPGRSGRRSASPGSRETAQSSEAMVKIARPTRKTRRWPSRSPIRPGEQQQAAEGDQVGVDDPGEVALGEAEAVLDRGQGDVDDRRVEDDHQHPRAEDVEGEPAAAVSRSPWSSVSISFRRFARALRGDPSRWFRKTTIQL